VGIKGTLYPSTIMPYDYGNNTSGTYFIRKPVSRKHLYTLSLRQESLGKEDDNGLKPFVGALWVSNPTR